MSRNMQQANHLLLNIMPDEVVSDIYMLRALVVDHVLCDILGTHVVNMYRDRSCEERIREKLSKYLA